jgi:peptide/nickel transport system permease protein
VAVRLTEGGVPVRQYFLRRLFLAALTIVGVLYFVFMFVRLALPGSVARQIIGDEGTYAEADLRRLESELGLRGNVLTYTRDFGVWLSDLARGDLGTSYVSGRGVAGDLMDRLPVTFEFGLLALIVGVALALPLGVVAAVKRNQPADYLSRTWAALTLAVPDFWVALLIVAFAGQVRLFHWLVPSTYARLTDDPLRNLAVLAVPVVILGAGIGGGLLRLTRAQMIDVLDQEYIRTARAKGLSKQAIVYDHAFRNALIPVVTVIGLRVPLLVGGAVILESIFNIPGIGRFFVTAMGQRDFPVVQGVMALVAVTVVLANLLVDLVYAWMDPRIRYR